MNQIDQTIFMEDILTLDFSMVKLKIQDKEEGLGWSKELCEFAEIEYKRFLILKRTYPEAEIVPNQFIDAFWHQHILDTQKYQNDCKEIFGYFLHHYPYFGMNGKEDYKNLMDAFEETKILYWETFGESYVRDSTIPMMESSSKCRAKCRTACKPVKCK